MMDLAKLIIESSSFNSLKKSQLLPEPYSDSGFFYIYYATEDYKEALVDIINFINKEVRVFYDRHIENGKAWEHELVLKAKSFSCRAIIFYLSENALKDELFWSLLKLVKEANIKYASINLKNEKGTTLTPEEMMNDGLDKERLKLFKSLFNKDVTYLSIDDSLANKIKGLESIGANDPLIYNIYSETSAKIVGVKSLSETRIVVPEKVLIGDEEYTVDLIEAKAFKGCKRLKEIILPPSIKHLGLNSYQLLVLDEEYEEMEDLSNETPLFDSSISGTGFVFEGCSELKEIILPDCLEELFLNNFVGCKSLKKIVVKNNIKKVIGRYFQGSSYFEDSDDVYLSLDELVVPPSFKYRIEQYYFSGKDGYQTIDLHGVKKVSGAVPIEEVKEYISQGEKVGDRFYESEIIETLDLSKMKGKYIQMNASLCPNLKKVILPDEAEIILTSWFDYCSSLEELVFGNNLKMVESIQLSGCDNLKSVTIPQAVTRFDISTFSACENLEQLIIDSDNAKNLVRSISKYGVYCLDSNHSLIQKITYPLLIWLSFLLLIFSRYFFIALLAFVFFPISVPIALCKKEIDPLKGLQTRQILLKKNHYRAPRLKGYVLDKESDNDEYYVYLRR